MDIALGLSRTCRYGGQIREDFVHYAVSEHSDLMTDWAIENGIARTLEEALSIKLHDGAEYVFGDIPTPLKRMLPDYDKMEKAAQDIIMESFGLHNNENALNKKTIKRIDQRIFLDECAKLLVDPGRNANLQAFNDANPTIEPLLVKIKCLDAHSALVDFTSHFISLCKYMPAADMAWRDSIEPHIEDAKNLMSRIWHKNMEDKITPTPSF